MELHKATFKDLEYILPLIIEYYENDRPEVDLSDEYVLDQTIMMVESDNCAVVYASKDGEVIGVAGVNVSYTFDSLQAQEVFWKVKDGFTKTKAGAMLLSALEDEAKEMNAEAFTVIALAGPHEKRVGNSYVSRGYEPVCSTYMKRLG